MMNNMIITEPSSNLRKLGRDALRDKWKIAIVAMLIYKICITLPALILDQVFGKTLAELYENVDVTSNYGYKMVMGVSQSAEKISAMSGVYILLVTGAFTLGLSIFFLNLFRKRGEELSQIFSGFEYFFKSLGLFVMVVLFTFLWSLLFFFPGIIAVIRYSQSFYILADDPSKGVLQCINESKRMMRGNKAKFFCMNLSFIGWMFLTAIVITTVNSILCSLVGNTSAVTVIINWILNLGFCWLTAYLSATQVVFYEILKGNLRASTYIPGEY